MTLWCGWEVRGTNANEKVFQCFRHRSKVPLDPPLQITQNFTERCTFFATVFLSWYMCKKNLKPKMSDPGCATFQTTGTGTTGGEIALGTAGAVAAEAEAGLAEIKTTGRLLQLLRRKISTRKR